MIDRRSILKSGLFSPFILFLPRHSITKPDKLQKIADYIEQEFVKALHAKNEVIESIKNTKIFYDINIRKFNKNGFYGFRDIVCNERIYNESTKIFNNNENIFCYGYSLEIKDKLNDREILEILNILWKKAGFKNYPHKQI